MQVKKETIHAKSGTNNVTDLFKLYNHVVIFTNHEKFCQIQIR